MTNTCHHDFHVVLRLKDVHRCVVRHRLHILLTHIITVGVCPDTWSIHTIARQYAIPKNYAENYYTLHICIRLTHNASSTNRCIAINVYYAMKE